MSKREPVLYKILWPVGVPVFDLLMRPKRIGTENIPKKGKIVLAGNHIKPLDTFMLFGSTTRSLHFLAKIELFKGPLKYFFNAAGIIPVDRSKKNHGALVAAEEYLNIDSAVCIFPEGTTNKTDAVMLPFKIGAIKMASDTDTPIVPFTITGQYKFRGPRPVIEFYEPFKVEGDDLAVENEKFHEFIYNKLVEKRETNA